MLSRSCQHLKLVSKQCFGYILPQSSKINVSRRIPLSISLCRSSSSAVNPVSFDDFSSIIDSLVKKDDRHNTNHTYVQKIKGVKSLDMLEQFCIDSRPTTPHEALLVLQRLLSLSDETNKDDITKFLKSETYVSLLSAQLLHDDLDLSFLLEAGACIFNLIRDTPMNNSAAEDDPLLLTPKFESFFATFMSNIKKQMMTSNVKKLDPDIVIAFYRALENANYSKVDGEFVNQYKEVLERKISDVTSSATITTLLMCLKKEDYENDKFIMTVVNKIEDLSSIMLLGELVNVFSVFAQHGYRKEDILQVLAEAIRNHTDVLTISQLQRLGIAIVKLYFYNQRLIGRYCSDLSNSVHKIFNGTQMVALISFLSQVRVTDELLWEQLLKRFKNMKGAIPFNDLRFCVGSLALVNVDPKLCSFLTTSLAGSLQPKPREDPVKWLNTIWALTVLQNVTDKLVESVLNEEFMKDLFSNEKANELQRLSIAQKLFQVNASAKFERKNYQGPLVNTEQFSFTDSNCTISKYGTKKFACKFVEFERKCIVPFSKRARYYPEYGTFIERLCYFNKETMKFGHPPAVKNVKLPLKDYIAVLYFNDIHTTSLYSDDEDEVNQRRLMGQYQLGVRLLTAAGAKVVQIFESELEKCSNNALDDSPRTVYMNEKVKQAAVAE